MSTTPFEFVAEAHLRNVRVLSFKAEERISDVYRVEALLSMPADPGAVEGLEGSIFGRPAALVVNAGDARRRLQGVVSAFRIQGVDAHDAHVHVELVPRLALLALRRQNRIFQTLTVPDIVGRVLTEWKIVHDFQLRGDYQPKPTCTQYGESDFDFVRRLLASEGIGFYFAQSHPGHAVDEAPAVVFFDSPSAYAAIDDAEKKHKHGRGALLRYAGHNFDVGDGEIADFAVRRELAPRTMTLGDFDFRRPQFGLHASSDGRGLASPPTAAERGLPLEEYAFRQLSEPGAGPAQIDDDRATRALDQLRAQARVASGTTRTGRLLPGHTFGLEEHPIDAFNQDYVVTHVEHRGRAPSGADANEQVYDATFSCVPAEITHRPPFERALRRVNGNETATVVGPQGEEIWTDANGRVKVRFHWDRDGKGDDSSSCWLRVSQGWSGQRWGMQFIPRVGMEVLVTFLGGDPDRPLVTGCLYNATHPTPFHVPSDRYRSGIRTNSAAGHNELSFDDQAGTEQIFLKAQRDLEFTVGNDHTAKIERNEQHRVRGNQDATVLGNRTEKVGGAYAVTVTGGLSTSTGGDSATTVGGDTRSSVGGNASQTVGGDLETHVEGRVQTELKDRAELTVRDDTVLRVDGHFVAVVGQHDARKSATLHVEGGSELYATGATDIVAEKALTLRVGTSSIRMTPDTIEIGAETLIFRGTDVYAIADEKMKLSAKKEGQFTSDKKIFLQAENGSLQLTRDARVDGDTVKLNCSPEPIDTKAPEEKKIKPTTISLVDDKGKPMKGQRFILVMADGSERSGVLGDDGTCELELEDSGDVVFPDVSKPQPA